MFGHLSTWYPSFLYPRESPDDESGGGSTAATAPAETTTAEPTPSQTTTPPPISFTSEQEEEMRRRISSARKDGEREGKAKADNAVAAAKAKADEDAALAKKIADGQFDEARSDLEKQRDAALAERDQSKQEVASRDATIARYEQAFEPIVASLHASITKVGTEALKGYDEKASAIDRMVWLNERKDFLVSLGHIGADGEPSRSMPRAPMTPRPNSDGKTDDDEAAKRRHATIYTG